MTRATLHPNTRRRIASFLAVLMFVGTIFPTGFASAQQLFAKPGAGVSRLPLNVTAFQADGFGDLTDAINLATGNVYLNVAGVSMNNFTGSGDDTSRAIGAEGWSLNARLRLQGFSKSLSSAPYSFMLGEGDGGGTPFERYTVTNYNNVPTWIERYENVSNATIYRNPEQDGVQYLEEFVVLLVRDNNSIAHYYDHSGNRYTFHDDGEFLDYVQDPHQQYRSAQAGSSEGREVKGEATILTYRNTSKGQLSKVQDPWGRITTYTWNGDDTLRYVNELLQDEDDSDSYVSRISFFYITKFNQRLMDKVFITRTNGLGQVTPDNHNMAGVDRRYLRFYYAQQPNGEILLNRFEREGVNGTSNRSKTFYRYDPQNRVTRVHTTDASSNHTETYTDYEYGTSSEFLGQQVTVEQGNKESIYEFDLNGQLRRKKVYDYNPRHPSEHKWVIWEYGYSDEIPKYYTCRLCEASSAKPKGSTYYVKQISDIENDPMNKGTWYRYDKHGNVIEIYEAALNNPTNDSSLNRSQVFDYDRDNRLRHEVMPPDYARLEDGTLFAEYTYNRVNHRQTFYPTITRNGQTFRTVKEVRRERVGTDEDADYTDTFDLYGRLVESKRVGEGQTQSTTFDYYYGTKNGSWQQRFPDDDGLPMNTTWTPIQYGDQVFLMRTTGEGTRTFTYDPYGNVIVERHTGGFSPKEGATRSRNTYRSFNGFGQPVWELAFEGSDPKAADAQVARRMWYYHAKTGDLDYSWEGNKRNVTKYTYIVGGADNGRVEKVEQGVSSSGDGTLSTVRSQTLFDYDEFGRVKEKKVDAHAVTNGFVTNYRYDTLDRVVEEIRPAKHGTTSRGLTGYKYDTTGQISYTWNSAASSLHFLYRDAFGRVTKEDWDTSAPIYTTYDPYDRPIAIRDERLEMNKAGEDRTRYFKYDLRGNLTHELGVPMRTGLDSVYNDKRRPYVIYHYDELNRKVKEQRLINGSTIVSPSNLIALSDDSDNVAVTEYSYNAADRLDQVTDSEGYITKYDYDKSGNVIKQVKQVCKTYQDTDCTSSVEGLTTIGNIGYAVATYTGYDAAGRPIWHKDARGNTRSTTYDRQGNATKQVNERNQKTEYVYTLDGLLEKVREPAIQPGGSGVVTTKYYTYGKRRYPTALHEARMKKLATSTTSPKTEYKYDWRGNVVKTTLPKTTDASGAEVSATVTQTYDRNGNLLSIIDAEGFETVYAYDKFGRVKSEHKKERADTVDAEAFPDSSGLKTTYWYDAAGNLIKEKRGTLYTYYTYNSLGKVTSESRPHTSNSASSYKRIKTYRLDGTQTAQTTYDYRGSLVLAGTSTVAQVNPDTLPTVTRGNITAYGLDKRGQATSEQSQGYSDGTSLREYRSGRTYNGLGLQTKRTFSGNSSIYAWFREPGRLSSGYNTYWRYDQNGNLKETWDARTENGGKQNHFSYVYSKTNKETEQYRTVEVSLDPQWKEGVIANGALVGATNGWVKTTYNARDLIESTKVSDNSPVDATSVLGNGETSTALHHQWNNTAYGYFNDGRLRQVTVASKRDEADGTKTFAYDQRGREVLVKDSNGYRNENHRYILQDSNGKYIRDANGDIQYRFWPTQTETTYLADGTVRQKVMRSRDYKEPTNMSRCMYQSINTPTVGGLVYESIRSTNDPHLRVCDDTNVATAKNTYSANGQVELVSKTRYNDETETTPSSSITYTYDAYGNVTEEVEGSTNKHGVYVYKKTRMYNYTINNDLYRTSYKPSSHSDALHITTYKLDSRGNRLEVGGVYNAYAGAKKRYDPNGRVAEFRMRNPDPNGDMEGKHLLFFRYDPFGHQVLAADGQLVQDQDPEDHRYYLLRRKSYTTVSVAGDVQFVRVRTGVYGATDQCSWFFCAGQVENKQDTWTEPVKNKSEHRIKNETFSMADSLRSQAWTLLEPFDLVTDAALPLEAPEEAVSDRLGVLPADVQAPEDASPEVGDITDVQAPQEGEEATSTDEKNGEISSTLSITSGLTSLGKLKSLGGDQEGEASQSNTQDQSLGGLQSLPALGETTPNTSQQTANTPFDLQAPESALPAGLAEVQASDVVAPESVTSDLPDMGDATEVQAPGASTPPPLGTSPSDGPLDVAPPASVQGPSAPEIGDGTPDAISKVAPPIGWEPPTADADNAQQIDPFSIIVNCKSGYTMHNGECKTSKEIDDDDKKKKQQQQNAEGGDEKSREEKEKEQIAEAFKGLGLSDAKLSRKVDDLYKVINNGLNPRQREEVISETAKLVSSGKLGKDDVDTYLQFLDKVVVPQNVQYAQYGAMVGSTWSAALPAAGTCALADTPAIGPGDVCGAAILGGAAIVTVGIGVMAAGDQIANSISNVWSNLFSKSNDEEANASGFSGSRRASSTRGEGSGGPIDIPRGTNDPANINGRDYTGHALDQMQGRGVPPSAVEEAIQHGEPRPGNDEGTTVHRDSRNGVSVVVDDASGRVITVITTGRD